MSNLYDNVEPNPDVVPEYAIGHIINHSGREFFITFLQAFPPDQKSKPVAKIIMTKEHMLELWHNVGDQIRKFDQDRKSDSDTPPEKRI